MASKANDSYLKIYSPEKGLFHALAKSPGLGGDAWCHLICGRDRALLIDTGFGIGDLKAMVERVTDLPITVVNTHFHGDHVRGNPQFGRVFIHAMDAEGLHPDAAARFTIPPEGTFYTAADLVPAQPYEVVTVEEGHVFDLGGGYEVEVFHLPGHTPGGIGLLDRKRRLLFSGDAIVRTPTYIFGPLPQGPHRAWCTVEAFRDKLLVLQRRKGEIDALYPGHSDLGISPAIIDDMVSCCEDLLRDPTRYDEMLNAAGRMVTVRIHGAAQIAFSRERVRA